jgi:hypothetical protein
MKAVCLGDFLGKLRQPEATGTQAVGREKETRIGVLAPQDRRQTYGRQGHLAGPADATEARYHDEVPARAAYSIMDIGR